jgi:hypothetical protein
MQATRGRQARQHPQRRRLPRTQRPLAPHLPRQPFAVHRAVGGQVVDALKVVELALLFGQGAAGPGNRGSGAEEGQGTRCTLAQGLTWPAAAPLLSLATAAGNSEGTARRRVLAVWQRARQRCERTLSCELVVHARALRAALHGGARHRGRPQGRVLAAGNATGRAACRTGSGPTAQAPGPRAPDAHPLRHGRPRRAPSP